MGLANRLKLQTCCNPNMGLRGIPDEIIWYHDIMTDRNQWQYTTVDGTWTCVQPVNVSESNSNWGTVLQPNTVLMLTTLVILLPLSLLDSLWDEECGSGSWKRTNTEFHRGYPSSSGYDVQICSISKFSQELSGTLKRHTMVDGNMTDILWSRL